MGPHLYFTFFPRFSYDFHNLNNFRKITLLCSIVSTTSFIVSSNGSISNPNIFSLKVLIFFSYSRYFHNQGFNAINAIFLLLFTHIFSTLSI